MHPVLRFTSLQAPNDNETFGAFVTRVCQGKVTWQEFARFNWGTEVPREVNRCLAETVGVTQFDAADPSQTVCLKARGRNMNLRVPLPYEAAALPVDKEHTVTVSKRRPPNAIRITKLSKWFLPKHEPCDLTYGLEGLSETADKVSMEVWASNYCKATPITENGLLKYEFEPLADVPVFQKDLTAGPQIAQRGTPDVTNYRGESTAADGVLKKRKDDRYLNAMSSPYTLMVKYFKQADDKKARISIGDFWPQFPAPVKTLDATSLKLKWNAKDCSRLQLGLIEVYDNADTLVWWKALEPKDFTDGDHEFDWNTWVTASAYAVTEAKMPYRIHIQGHTDKDEANGLAVAAMQTEVRFHQDSTIGAQPADQRHTEPQCLSLSPAPFLPKRTAASPDNDVLPKEGGKSWYKLQLNEAGYQAGPAQEDTDSDHLKLALAEFQRCVPKNDASPFKRMKADGKTSSDAKSKLKNVPADYKRALFADTARADQTLTQVEPVIDQPGSDLVVWVENRHYYTKLDAEVKKALPDSLMDLENYGGDMSMPDATRLDTEKKSVARPWLPLQVKIPMLTKADDMIAAGGGTPAYLPAMLEAAGPVRVDWKFTELPPDYTNINSGGYNSDGRNVTRTRRFVRETIETLCNGVTHNGVNTGNCPEAEGGIRPAANYHREAFGRAAESLAPWRALEDDTTQSVFTFAHDDLGQPDKQMHPTHRGYAGAYFHPSRIAGDGYRVQVNLSMAVHPAGGKLDHPNREVLARRYTHLPQGHSCKMRLWRKTIFRGYSEWSTANPIAYAAFSALTARQYEASFVHFAHQSGAPQIHPLPLNPATSADVTKYKDIIEKGMKKGGKRKNYPKRKKMALSRANHWPYLAEDFYGLPWDKYSDLEVSNFHEFMGAVKNQTIFNYNDNLMLELLYRIERDTGHLAGHYSVLWQAVPQMWLRNYVCGGPNKHVVLVTERLKNERKGVGKECVKCTGKLKRGYIKYYECTNGDIFIKTEDAVADANPACPTCGATTAAYGVAQTIAHGTDDVRKYWGQGFSEPAIGQALGTLWLYFDTTLEGNGNRMAHEYGHNRHLEHNPSVDPTAGYDASQHDTTPNTVTVFTADETTKLYHQWDHRCMMSYCPDPTPGGDKDPLRYFCGKCALKHRGWAVNSLAAVAGGLSDP